MYKKIIRIAIKIYNTLPNTLKELTIAMYKRKLFDLLLEKMYYDINEFLLGTWNLEY